LRPAEVQRAERAWLTRELTGDRTGLDAAWLAHVFDRFRTGTDANGSRGTGLGLALVRAVADTHGGSARVRSVPGEGSEFEVILPAG
jgi:signal transduction histidine kinase